MKKKYEELQEMMNVDRKKMENSFQGSVDGIRSVFQKYSVEDVATSIFISDIWLNNIASPVKHQLLATIFTATKIDEYSVKNRIITYENFKEFLTKVYDLIPSFNSMEDYVPEPDWGEIKFHCSGRNYRMFYGNELSNINEYLTIFEMLYDSYKNEYVQYTQNNPTDELRQCLLLQETIITGITGQPRKENLEISLGNLEIPPEEFWKIAQTFYSEFKPEEIVTKNLINRFSIGIGEYPKECLSFEKFGSGIFEGTTLPVFFVKHQTRYFPILPRRYSAILFYKWGEIFQEYSEKVEPSKIRYTQRLGAMVHKYIKERIDTDSIFPLVSAVVSEGKPHETIFTTCFISGNKLILVYLTHPRVDLKNIEEELKKIAAEFNRALELVASQPTTLFLHLDKQNLQFISKSEQGPLKPEILIIVPHVSAQMQSFSIPEDLPGRIIFLDSFLGIVDEFDSVDTLAAFLDYLDEVENKTPGMLSILDMFASFKDSHETLIDGALEPDFVMLDPHWGTTFRYNTLAEFWNLYPEVDYFGHPRTWRLKKETSTRLRLESRGYFGLAIYRKLDQTNVFLTAPFEGMEYFQGSISNLLMECLEDSMSRRLHIFCNHNFFKKCKILHINFFPISLIIAEDKRFQHLDHLKKVEKFWLCDIVRLDQSTYGIRIVFDEKKIQEFFISTQDCSFEVNILVEVLTQLNSITPDSQMRLIVESLEKTKSEKPRFKMFSAEKCASFPEFINALEPEPKHFKRAKKKIAKLARLLKISEGEYEVEDAKEILNNIRDAVVREINVKVSEYDLIASLPFLLTRIDALSADYERHSYVVEHGIEHEIDYQPEVVHAEKNKKYIEAHKNYRYLIEKFVQIEPTGKNKLEKDKFQYLIALIDWLHVFYSSSDSLHYRILPVGMKLNRDYLVDVTYEESIESKLKDFSEVEAQLKLELIGNPDDRVDSSMPIEDFLEGLDAAFVKDLGFGFQNMINVLQIMCFWPNYARDVQESTSYNATESEIRSVCVDTIESLTGDEVKIIIEFLTLKKDDVTKVLGQDGPSPDLPVWEYRKRCARYNLKPLIKLDSKYHWGPYSARRTGIIWSGASATGSLPVDLQAINIERMLRAVKKIIEDGLEDKTYEIVTRYTTYCRKNLRLHELKPKGAHPPELGEFDVLSFHLDKNIMFNIECKDILPPHCLKDAKRLREKIFGRDGKGQGYFETINRRAEYLKNSIVDVAKSLNWPIDTNNPPQIITVYLSRRNYWWTSYPPEGIEAEFVRVDLLSDFIKNF